MADIVNLKALDIKTLRTEIELLRNQLEYAYRCIEAGYTGGVFDFRIVRQEARDFLAELEKKENKIIKLC